MFSTSSTWDPEEDMNALMQIAARVIEEFGSSSLDHPRWVSCSVPSTPLNSRNDAICYATGSVGRGRSCLVQAVGKHDRYEERGLHVRLHLASTRAY